MIDPIHSLAFSIQANRGVYAILLGSGVSRAAKIPTGWEITLDLIRKLAALHKDACEPTPEVWYQEKFGTEPDYSVLLEALAKTSLERQQLLRGYWEPSESEREEEAKQPTDAHRAISALVAGGFIKVILTTNFDRLMETALRDEGIEPSVLSTSDQVAGALPLIHTEVCVFKVHGDYLDPRIRNTQSELDTYPPEFDLLLDRILDEFGMIVCGWSSDWDGALRRAFLRAKSRRFTTFWTTRGEPSEEAQTLIAHRRAEAVEISDAESFFHDLRQHVESIEEFSRPHPLSTEAAVASLKRYISDTKYRVQLRDLVHAEVEQIVELTSTDAYAVQGGPNPDAATVTGRVRRYQATCSTLLEMASAGAFWAEEEHHAIWQRALIRLYPTGVRSGTVLWLDLQKYPATLLLYSLGLGAVESDRLEFLGDLLGATVKRENSRDISIVEALPPSCIISSGREAMQLLEGMESHYVPLNDWIHANLREVLRHIVPDDERYTFNFDKFEILTALACGYRYEPSFKSYWAPPGAFGYRHKNRERAFEEIRTSLTCRGDDSPFVASRIFGQTVGECTAELKKLEGFVGGFRWW